LTGGYYTKYGSSIGAAYPPDPDNYPYCADASNPIRIKCLPTPERALVEGAFAHELGHVFTQGYPYVTDQNVETGANYLRDWLYDPRGGQGMGVNEYLRHEWQLLQSLVNLGPTSTWPEALGNDGLMLVIKNHVGGWSFLADTLGQYAANYAGIQSSLPSDQRGQDFVRSLVSHVPSSTPMGRTTTATATRTNTPLGSAVRPSSSARRTPPTTTSGRPEGDSASKGWWGRR
jgi:hypothetical protein